MNFSFLEPTKDPLNRKINNLSVYIGLISLPKNLTWNKETISSFITEFINVSTKVYNNEGILCPIVDLTDIGIPTNVSLTNIIEVQKLLGPQIVVTNNSIIGAIAGVFNNSTIKFVDSLKEAQLIQSAFIDEYIASQKKEPVN